MGTAFRARRPILTAMAAVLVVLLTWVPASVARAQDPAAQAYAFEGHLTPEGLLEAEVTITYDSAPEQVQQRLATRQAIDATRSWNYEIDNVSAAIGGSAVDVTTDTDGDYLVITIDTSQAGSEPIRLSYTVDGTTRTEQGTSGDLTVFSWRVLQGLSTGVGIVTGMLNVGAMPQVIDCVAGPPGSVNKCELYSAGVQGTPTPTFQSSDRGAGEQVTLTVGVAADVIAATADIDESWSLDRAFRITPATALSALAALLAGLALLYLLWRRIGDDHSYEGEGTLVATFRPVADGRSIFEVRDSVRPGEVGTIADEHVDPVDITATLLDLAVRGHLRITELPHGPHEVLDWKLTRTTGGDTLLAYEQRFLDAIAPIDGETLVSQLPETIAPALEDIQSDLYDEVVSRGWFEHRPDSTRNKWRTLGVAGVVVALVVGAVLVAFTSFGLLALVLLLVAGLLVWIAPRMPRRTQAGSRVLTGMRALSALLTTQPTDRMPQGREIEEISRLLPYAVVLGGKQRWLQAMVEADDCAETPDPYTIDWYHAPETWHLQDLPASLTQFVNTVQGELFAR